ncbi:LysB [Rhodococcus phage ReqiPepy6]|uniref:LysB n=1 Tax=Rhodococcus phage ReqiPepy6 TaxID=691965 RepID=D4P7E4_9CAUD|nr:LysB [Rhodococcus phage ReqiPepy6]ADD80924.1 LysB [Rhodococcus phage ReqiPepy6]
MHIIYADGIGSSAPGLTTSQSILHKVVERLIEHNPVHTKSRVEWPASMASVGGPLSWTEASKIGVADVNRIIDTHSNPGKQFILLAYSGGNRVIHEWMEQNPEKLHKIAAVGLMSDPWRPRTRQQYGLPPTVGWGICGEKLGPIISHTFWVSAPGDAISDALPDAILRTAADVSDVMPGQFLGDLGRHVKAGDLQLAWKIGEIKKNPLGWFLGLGPRLQQARIDINGYMGGNHTTAYLTPWNGGPSLAHRLADTINFHISHPS